jgi:uncharacterized surface protein with fasciclin (FAS1) repeats
MIMIIKRELINKKILPILVMLTGLALGFTACEKVGLDDSAAFSHAVPDTTHDIRAVFAASRFTLFKQAANRVKLDQLLAPAGYFTILAPTDAAMQNAGLTADVINTLPEDSLQKIVRFHVVTGSYGALALNSAITSIETNTLLQEIIPDKSNAANLIYQQRLYLKRTKMLFVNGEPVNKESDTALTAGNGYVWPVDKVLQRPMLTAWETLLSRPELSMFVASIRLADSMYAANRLMFPGNPAIVADSLRYNSLYYANKKAEFGITQFALPMIMAPVNDAFKAAGFKTVNDIRAFATRVKPSQFPTVFLPIDSVLKQHALLNFRNIFTNISFYNDLLYNPYINNGQFNNYIGTGNMIMERTFFPQFQPAGGTVKVKWTDDPAIPMATLYADPQRHMMTRSGVIYETDQLFYHPSK